MTTGNMVTKRLVAAVGNGAGAACGAGGSGLAAPGLAGPGAGGLASQSPEGRPPGQVSWRGGGRSARRTGASGVRRAGGLLRHLPGSSLLSSTSPLFVPLPLGCQIWLTQSVVSLRRLAPGPELSALHHCSSPCTGRGEEWGGQRARGRRPPRNFPSRLPARPPASVPLVVGASGSSPGEPRGRARALM